MKVLFLISHPAHFHMYKNVIGQLKQDGHDTIIVIRPKDILVQLCDNFGLKYTLLKERPKKYGLFGLALSVIQKTITVFKIVKQNRPDILMASDGVIAWVGWLLRIPSFECSEDDAEAISLYARIYYPFYTGILSPDCCSAWKWNNKKIGFPSYHELGYLHPNHFKANENIAKKYGIDTSKPFFIIRLAQLTAHHDVGIHGLTTDMAQRLIDMLNPFGSIYITSERALEPQFEKYKIKIDPLDMHHIMAFASIYIGDSQTMAAEAGVLGVPFIRLNDFVGRLSYLHELEYPTDYFKRDNNYVPSIDKHVPDNKHYSLGYGHKSIDMEGFFQSVDKLLSTDNKKQIFEERRQKMLSEKIDYAKFLTWFIENYPESKTQVNDDAEFWSKFK